MVIGAIRSRREKKQLLKKKQVLVQGLSLITEENRQLLTEARELLALVSEIEEQLKD